MDKSGSVEPWLENSGEKQICKGFFLLFFLNFAAEGLPSRLGGIKREESRFFIILRGIIYPELNFNPDADGGSDIF